MAKADSNLSSYILVSTQMFLLKVVCQEMFMENKYFATCENHVCWIVCLFLMSLNQPCCGNGPIELVYGKH